MVPSEPEKTFWVYILLALGGGVGAAGDAALNRWVQTNRSVWMGVSLILCLATVLSFAWLLKWRSFNFGSAVILWLLVHSTLAVILDHMYFGGRLTAWQWAGIGCALAAIILINHGSVGSCDMPITEASQEARADES